MHCMDLDFHMGPFLGVSKGDIQGLPFVCRVTLLRGHGVQIFGDRFAATESTGMLDLLQHGIATEHIPQSLGLAGSPCIMQWFPMSQRSM